MTDTTETPIPSVIAATFTLNNSVVIMDTECATKDEGLDHLLQLMSSVGNALCGTDIMGNPFFLNKSTIESVSISDYNEMKRFNAELKTRLSPGPFDVPYGPTEADA